MNINTLKQNIQVVVRIRPTLVNETKHSKKVAIENNLNEVVIEGQSSLQFDQVFGIKSQQQEIFEAVAIPIIDSFISGYSTSILAYGQTSSGKTYTLGEPKVSLLNDLPKVAENQGLIPRVIMEFWKKLRAKQQLSKQNQNYEVKINYVEVYNEQLQDLLAEADNSKELQIRDKVYNGYTQIYIQNATEITVRSAQEMIGCFVTGGKNRVVGETKMNKQSSRSHSVFNIFLEQKIDQQIFKSKLSLVDLAGSERLSKTGATKGKQFNEMVGINQGLMALGNCINLLNQKNVGFIPYRDSKLTRILQDSIGGSSKCIFIACVSCSAYNKDESIQTLNYAARAKNIVNKPIKIIETAQLEAAHYQQLEDENRQLKETVAQLQDTILELQQLNEKDPRFDQSLQRELLQSQKFNTSLFQNISQNAKDEFIDKLEEIFEKSMQNQHYSYTFVGKLLEFYKEFACKLLINQNFKLSDIDSMLAQGFRVPNEIQNVEPEIQFIIQLGGFLKAYVFHESRFDYSQYQDKLANASDFSFCDVNKIRKLINQSDKQSNDLLTKSVAELRLLHMVRPLIGTDWDWSGMEKREDFMFKSMYESQFLDAFSESVKVKKSVAIIDADGDLDYIDDENEQMLPIPQLNLQASIEPKSQIINEETLIVHESLINESYEEESEELDEELEEDHYEDDYDYNELKSKEVVYQELFENTAPDVILSARPKSAQLNPLVLGNRKLSSEITEQIMQQMRKIQPPKSAKSDVFKQSVRPPSTDELQRKLQSLEMFLVNQNLTSGQDAQENELNEIDCSPKTKVNPHPPICIDIPNSTKMQNSQNQLRIEELIVPQPVCVDVPSSTKVFLTSQLRDIEATIAMEQTQEGKPQFSRNLEVSGFISEKRIINVLNKEDLVYKPFNPDANSHAQPQKLQNPITSHGPLAARPISAGLQNLKQLTASQLQQSQREQIPPRQLNNQMIISTGNAKLIEVEPRRPTTGMTTIKPIDTSQKLTRRVSGTANPTNIDHLQRPVIHSQQLQKMEFSKVQMSINSGSNLPEKQQVLISQGASGIERNGVSSSKILLRRKPPSQ